MPIPPPLMSQQTAALAACAKRRSFGFLMEQGTGKTRVGIERIRILFRAGIIDAVLISAPNDVHAQWLDEQLPEHAPDLVEIARMVIWDASSNRIKKSANELLKPISGRLPILALNHEAFATKAGKTIADKFLRKYKCLFIWDESHTIKTPSVARTRAAVRMAPKACVRYIMTGTPMDKPFDLYSQFKFLNPQILGFDTFIAFKHYYGEWVKEFAFNKKRQEKVEYESLQQYVRMDELSKAIGPYVYICKKTDCLDLPAKVPAIRMTHMSPAQLDIYARMVEDCLVLLERRERREIGKEEFGAWLATNFEDEEELNARLIQSTDRMSVKVKLTTILRLQQIMGGFVTDDTGHTTMIEGKPPPRAHAAMEQIIEAASQQSIIWARYTAEIEMLSSLLQNEGIRCCTLYGKTPKGDRRSIAHDFQHGRYQVLVGNQQVGGTGLNLQACSNMLFYSNGFSYIKRVQAEDRAHRIGQTKSLTITDMISRDSPLDAQFVAAHKEKSDMATKILSGATNFKELIKC